MPKVRRAITPWAQLSVAFDLADRAALPLPMFGDVRGRAARIWKFERFCRWLRRIVQVVLVISTVACIAVGLMSLTSSTITQFLLGDDGFIAMLLVRWFVAWIALSVLTYIVGFCIAPWRLRVRTLILLHAERLRRRNAQSHAFDPPSRHFIKARLASTSLVQELISPLIFILIVAIVVVYGTLSRGAARVAPGFFVAPLLIPIVIIFTVRLTGRPAGLTAKGIDLAFREGACPKCHYSLAGAGPPLKIKRCPECGMRFPCRLPVNIPIPQRSIMKALGVAFRKRLG